jgi:hypothetical protein
MMMRLMVVFGYEEVKWKYLYRCQISFLDSGIWMFDR